MSAAAILRDLVVGFNTIVLFYFIALNSIYLILFLISLFEVLKFVRRTFFSDYRQIMQSDMTWPISILIPAADEEKSIVDTVRSLLMINYGEFEIIVINDGSTDETLTRLIDIYELRRMDRPYKRTIPTDEVRAVYGSLAHPNLTVVDKAKAGKADALNVGINLARYPLYCSIDADSIIEDNALLRVVKPFLEKPIETIAAGGIVRIVNGCEVKDGRVTRIALSDRALPILQVVEYLRAFLTGRVGWSNLQSLLIISGAFGIYKKQ
jgi:cellulose synthase/poly-beta-1,6-N-acetylglucosamine synthase-like glycosyltransferase